MQKYHDSGMIQQNPLNQYVSFKQGAHPTTKVTLRGRFPFATL